MSPSSTPPPPPLTTPRTSNRAPGVRTHEFNLHRMVIVDEVTEFFKTVGVSDFTFESCKLWGWRCHAKLAIHGSPENPLIGLYQEGTHNVVDIPQSHHPSINTTVELLKQASAHDQDVFSFYEDEQHCNGFEEVLTRYGDIVPHL